MKYFLTLLFFIHTSANAFTLIQINSPKFPVSNVNVEFSADSCANTGTSIQEWRDIVEESIDNYWNTVASSSLRLKISGFSTATIATDDYVTSIGKASTNSILIGCSTSTTIFPITTNVASGRLNWNDPKQAVVLINNTPGTAVALMSRESKIIVLAHEIGHTLGLGHSSYPDALMYYNSTYQTLKTLHKDDIDGITYLYPNHSPVSCGTVMDIKNDTPLMNNFIISLLFGLFLLALPKKIAKSLRKKQGAVFS
jgi:hypothetical protein